jgi:hypothetical protein
MVNGKWIALRASFPAHFLSAPADKISQFFVNAAAVPDGDYSNYSLLPVEHIDDPVALDSILQESFELPLQRLAHGRTIA